MLSDKIIWVASTPDSFDGPEFNKFLWDEIGMWPAEPFPKPLKPFIMETEEVTLGAYLLQCREHLVELSGYDDATAKEHIENSEEHYEQCWRDKVEPINAVRDDMAEWDD